MSKIIVITDERFTFPLLEMFLNSLGYNEILLAKDIETLNQIITQTEADLMIIDTLKKDFVQFCEAKLPFILILNEDDTNDQIQEIKQKPNFTGQLIRPLTKDSIEEVLKNFFSIKN